MFSIPAQHLRAKDQEEKRMQLLEIYQYRLYVQHSELGLYISLYIYTQVISNLPKLLTAGMSYAACGLYLEKSTLQQLSITTRGRRDTAGGK